MLKSYAKLNIFLKILGREKGFHMLESLFVYLDLYDELDINTSSEFSLVISGPYASSLSFDLRSYKQVGLWESSIFAKVCKVFDKYFKIKDKFSINLHKNIPIGSGLGGGSSNAAVFLEYLLNFYSISLTESEKFNLAAEIGADCAFFMQKHARLVYGYGNKIGAKIHLDPCEISLILPKFQANTQEIFTTYQRISNQFSKPFDHKDLDYFSHKRFDKEELIYVSKIYGNDLLFAFLYNLKNYDSKIASLFIETDDIFMSGSGSTFFKFGNVIKEMTMQNSCDIIKKNILKS